MGFDINFDISAAAVFVQGLLSFFSPCVLPLLPLYAAYLSGSSLGAVARGDASKGSAEQADSDAAGGRQAASSARSRRVRLLVNTLFFVIGISAAFFLLGLGMSAVSSFFSSNRRLFSWIGGGVIMLFGLYQLGVFGESAALSRERRLPFDVSKAAMSPLTAFVLGFLFSFSWTPCVGPMLSSVLIMAAGSSSRAAGFALLGVYSLGFCLPFMAVGIFADRLLDVFRKNRDMVKHSAKIGGAIMLVIGTLMVSGQLDRLSALLSGQPAATPSSGGSSYEQEAGKQDSSEAEKQKTSEDKGQDAAEDPASNKAPCYETVLKDQNGEEHSLADYEGKIIFLNFWATWCPPCRAEMPYIQEVYESYQDKEDSDVVFLGVAFPGSGSEGDADYVAKFLDSNGYTYPVLMDEKAEFAGPYGVSAIPMTYMINEKGEIYGYITGGLDKATIESIIDQTRNAGIDEK